MEQLSRLRQFLFCMREGECEWACVGAVFHSLISPAGFCALLRLSIWLTAQFSLPLEVTAYMFVCVCGSETHSNNGNKNEEIEKL